MRAFFVYSSSKIFFGSFFSIWYNSDVVWPRATCWFRSFYLNAYISGNTEAVAKSSSWTKFTRLDASFWRILICTSFECTSFSSYCSCPSNFMQSWAISEDFCLFLRSCSFCSICFLEFWNFSLFIWVCEICFSEARAGLVFLRWNEKLSNSGDLLTGEPYIEFFW